MEKYPDLETEQNALHDALVDADGSLGWNHDPDACIVCRHRRRIAADATIASGLAEWRRRALLLRDQYGLVAVRDLTGAIRP